MNQAPQARISGMNFKTRTKIADLLDIERPFNDDIRMVGHEIGFRYQEIQLIWNKRGFARPTLEVFQQWQGKPDATIRKFRDILVGMDRWDVIEIIDKEYPQLAGADQGDGNKGSPFAPPSFRNGIDIRDIYPMNHRPRGKAFIINNETFQPSSGMHKCPRNGTDADAEALDRLFHGLGFDSKVYNNQSKKDIFAIADLYANMDHSNYDCLMCAILTHGEEGLIYSTDGKIPIKELTSKFRTRRLLGKPKIFFFQASQGFEYMEGVDQPNGADEPDVDEVDSPGNKRFTLPIEADFLFAYSTVPGYYSWRNSLRGSWFAQAIVSVFNEHAATMELTRMLTRVNALGAKQKPNTNDCFSDNKKQIPSVISQLRKELYFFPENVVANYHCRRALSTTTMIEKREKSERKCCVS